MLSQEPVQLRRAQGGERGPQVCPAHLGDKEVPLLSFLVSPRFTETELFRTVTINVGSA